MQTDLNVVWMPRTSVSKSRQYIISCQLPMPEDSGDIEGNIT